jgi:hypothetical protein
MSKEDKSFLVGVTVSVIIALVLNLMFRFELGWSVLIALIAGVIAGFAVNKLQK